MPRAPAVWVVGVLALSACRRPPPAPNDRLVALRCTSETACEDPAGRRYECVASAGRTGVSQGRAGRCRPARCDDCAWSPTLSGEVVNSNGDEPAPAPGAVVRAWRAGDPARVEARADARGRYRFLGVAGASVFVQSERAGEMRELHAVRLPASGWDVPLDLRSAATVRRLLGDPPDVDPAQGLVVVEFTGTEALDGLGAQSSPPAAAAFSFDTRGAVARGARLTGRSRRLLILAGLRGEARVTLLPSPAVRCAPQVGEALAWPVEPGTVTQIDAECVELRPGAPPGRGSPGPASSALSARSESR